jgi:hypothetical protein
MSAETFKSHLLSESFSEKIEIFIGKFTLKNFFLTVKLKLKNYLRLCNIVEQCSEIGIKI